MERARFDLVTLDMRMKGMDGIETLRRMKERDANLPVIISSAYEEYKDDFGSWPPTPISSSPRTRSPPRHRQKILDESRASAPRSVLQLAAERERSATEDQLLLKRQEFFLAMATGHLDAKLAKESHLFWSLSQQVKISYASWLSGRANVAAAIA